MAETSFSKADDPRKKPVWRKKEAAWETNWKAHKEMYEKELIESEKYGGKKGVKSIWDFPTYGTSEN